MRILPDFLEVLLQLLIREMLETDKLFVGVNPRADELVKFGVDGAIVAVCVFWIKNASGR
jgi:hypothetical protein